MEKNSVEIFTGKGEIKKRKRGFLGDIAFNFKGREFMSLNINNEVKSQKERNYVFKMKSFYRTYTISTNIVRDKKTVKRVMNFCKNENDHCITLMTTTEEDDGKINRHIIYKRADIELHFDRIFEEGDGFTRRSLVVSSGEKRYGYDFKYGFKDKLLKMFVAIIIPSRKMSIDTKSFLSFEKPTFALEIQSDAEKHSDRKLNIDIAIDNQIKTHQPSKLKMQINHPVLEKPLDITYSANYDASKAKFFELEAIYDYSNNPEDKVLSKLYMEKVQDGVINVNTKVYHQDLNHLDFTVKTNVTCTESKKGFALEWIWTGSSGKEETAYLTVHYERAEEQFLLLYHRPKIDFSISTSAAPQQSLHEDLPKVDIQVQYNEAVTKAQLVKDLERSCYQFNIFGSDGKTKRQVEVCADVRKPVMFSLMTWSKEDDAVVFDYSLEVIRTPLRALSIRHHWNPEFLGGATFQFSQLTEELSEAGVGTLPISDSPDYQKMRQTYLNKVTNPLRGLILDEIKKTSKEMLEEAVFLKNKAHEYYRSLPSSPLGAMIRRILKVLKPVIDEFVEDMWDRMDEIKSQFVNACKNLIDRLKEYPQNLRDACERLPECYHLRKAILERDFTHISDAVKNFISRLPEPVQEYLKQDGIIEQWIRKFISFVHPYVKKIMDSEFVKTTHRDLHNYRIALQENLLKALKYFSDFTVHAFQEHILDSTELQKIVEDVRNFDVKGLYTKFIRVLEDFFGSLKLPTIRDFFKIHTLEGERGVFNFEIYFPIDLSALKTVLSEIASSIYKLSNNFRNYNWKHLLVKIKRISDFQFIPPYREQAMIVSDQHYVTFDKTFYDFAGECAYLLADDLEDGNFSLAITPLFSLETDKATGKREHSLVVFVKDSAVLVNLLSKEIKAGNQLVDLPYFTKDLSVTRKGDFIFIDGDYGVQVKCHAVHQLCTVTINGYYYGKTAGLFGTYDYEPSNDFRRPKGQIPNSVTTFTKSWDISKGCKTKNLAQEGKITSNSPTYRQCNEYFKNETSPLSACFSEVSPEKYLELCYRHISISSQTDKALCNIAAAYVSECESNYIELNLPPKCVSCEAPDGSIMQHGDKKKYENIKSKSMQTVFVVESHSCNTLLLKDLDVLARSIDRELVNEGYENNLFGLVVFGSNYEPLSYTYQGDLMFPHNRVSSAARRIQLNANTSNSALEALRLAATYPFLATTSKSIILVACSPCNYDYKSLQYPVIQQILLEHEIALHVISKQEIKLRKASSKERTIIGMDAETVYTNRDVSQKELVGEPTLRAQTSVSKDACIALAQDVNGSFFTSRNYESEVKIWRSIFSRRLLKSAPVSNCRWCDCSVNGDHVSKVVCRPCTARRPKLPFSVCITCALPELFTSIYSYLLHVVL